MKGVENMGSFRVLNDTGEPTIKIAAGNWATDGIEIVKGVANALAPNSGYLARAVANGQVTSLTSSVPAQTHPTQAATVTTADAPIKSTVASNAPLQSLLQKSPQSADTAKQAIASLGAKIKPTATGFSFDVDGGITGVTGPSATDAKKPENNGKSNGVS